MSCPKYLYSIFFVIFFVCLIFINADDVKAQSASDGSGSAATEKKEEKMPDLPPFKVPYDPNIPTKRVLISSFDIGVPGLPQGLKAERGLKAQLTTALSKSKNFMVIDRETVSDLRDELLLKKSRAVTKESSVSAGKLMGAQVVIKGVVTEFSETAVGKSTGTKVSLGKVAEVVGIFEASDALDALVAADPNFKGGKETVTGVVGMDIRLIDINTGAVITSIDARGKVTRKNAQLALGVAGLSTVNKVFEKTVIGQATRMAIRDAVLKIFDNIKKIPWTGMVAAVKPDGTVIINAGSNQNISMGQEMFVESEGNKITDPATGLVIYTERVKTAEISIFSVKDAVSFGRVVSNIGNHPIQRGDIVTLKE